MPQKHKNNKIRIKINDKKITNYMFDFTRTIIFVFAIISVAFTFIIRDANVVGNSMLDTLHSDDKIFITNFMYEPKCGDIVAINAENQIEKRIIKRVIAVEGQTLVVDYSKNAVYVDGIKIDEPYVSSLTREPSNPLQIPYVIPEGYIFVMGDNRIISLDSRDKSIGLVSVDDVIGKAQFIFFRLTDSSIYINRKNFKGCTYMSEMQTIQWFPGHMTKTKRQIQSSLKLVDAVAEIIDARIPASSRNPDLAKLVQNKPRVILLNKCDMANQTATKMWIDYFKKQNLVAIPVDCKSGRGLDKFAPAVNTVMSHKIARLKEKGMVNPTIRIMIVGIPNVGKSSFINKMVKKNRAKVEDRPGVTRGNQWYTIAKNLEMLDTPGVLWPKFDDKTVGEHLAFTGAVKDQILDIELLAVRLLDFIKELKPADFITRFKLENEDIENIDSYELLKMIGKKRGMLVSGGEIDTERAAIMLLDEFRSAKLGRITVEMPQGR